MPIYEYRCTSCNRVVEAIQKLNDPPLTVCESCKGKLEKIVSRTAFQLKGGGWFDQGYSGGSKSSGSEPGSSSGSDSKDKGKAKGEVGGGGNGSKTSGGCGSGSCGCAH